MFNKILCPADGSEHSEKALNLAIDLAKKYDAELLILPAPHRPENIEAMQRFAGVQSLAKHVNTGRRRRQPRDDRIALATGSAFQDSGVSAGLLVAVGQHVLHGAKGHAEKMGLEKFEARLESGDPPDRILRGVDRVVMGLRRLSNVQSLFPGSVPHKGQTVLLAPAIGSSSF